MSGELYTVTETAEYLKLSTKTVLRLISDKKILASKVSDRSWRIRQSDIESYLSINTNVLTTDSIEEKAHQKEQIQEKGR